MVPFAADLACEPGRLAQHARGQMDIEASPHGRAAGLRRDSVCERLAARFPDIGCAEEPGAPLAGAARGPRRKSAGRRFEGSQTIFHRRRRSAGGDVAFQRAASVEGGAAGGLPVLAINQQGRRQHRLFLLFWVIARTICRRGLR
jgi:hypothetical protein